MMKTAPLVLVIDDDPDICTMISVMLEYNSYEVRTAEGDSEAFAVINTNPVKLIIMDMLLSGIDGRDICRNLKSDPATSSIPVIMFSAHPNAKETCIAAGADDFIAKPFEMSELLEKVNEKIDFS